MAIRDSWHLLPFARAPTLAMPPTITKPENGVLFPADPKSGKRSTLSGGKAVFSAAETSRWLPSSPA